ncbi:MAG: GatB/YqeY domain-containing protein [Dehalococcoidia bacterium]|nr:GatB/YqeY domain-containing protein [Dehalococcoidia bacterium]
MTLHDSLRDELTAAVRGGDTRRRDILRLLIAALDNARIAARHELSDAESVVALQREAKQRRDSIEQYRAGGRDDLARAEEDELEVIAAYLPAELDDVELRAQAEAVIALVGAGSAADIGRVMGPLMQRVAGRAEGGRVSALVRELLTASG